jgi:hypothetical protein
VRLLHRDSKTIKVLLIQLSFANEWGYWKSPHSHSGSSSSGTPSSAKYSSGGGASNTGPLLDAAVIRLDLVDAMLPLIFNLMFVLSSDERDEQAEKTW